MPSSSIPTPNIGLEGYFTFKEPINFYVRNKYNLDEKSVKLKVVSLISMGDIIVNDMKDPYTDLYEPAGIGEGEYKKDLIDRVPLVTLAFLNDTCNNQFLRVPLNYIDSISDISSIDYHSKVIMIDLNKLPVDLKLSPFFKDLSDFIETRVGITPDIKEVSLGRVEFVDALEHTTRETIRNNMVSVHKTTEIQLEEITTRYNELLHRLDEMGIMLTTQ